MEFMLITMIGQILRNEQKYSPKYIDLFQKFIETTIYYVFDK